MGLFSLPGNLENFILATCAFNSCNGIAEIKQEFLKCWINFLLRSGLSLRIVTCQKLWDVNHIVNDNVDCRIIEGFGLEGSYLVPAPAMDREQLPLCQVNMKVQFRVVFLLWSVQEEIAWMVFPDNAPLHLLVIPRMFLPQPNKE